MSWLLPVSMVQLDETSASSWSFASDFISLEGGLTMSSSARLAHAERTNGKQQHAIIGDRTLEITHLQNANELSREANKHHEYICSILYVS